jgi:hypothetical protein
MPELTRWFIKAGLVYFILALLIAIGLKIPALPFLSHLTPVYYHLLVIGWITQIIMGVSHWMFPRFSKEKPRGNEVIGRGAFIFLNAGLILRLFSEPIIFVSPTPLLQFTLVLSAFLQWSGGLLYGVHTWGRVRAR